MKIMTLFAAPLTCCTIAAPNLAAELKKPDRPSPSATGVVGRKSKEYSQPETE